MPAARNDRQGRQTQITQGSATTIRTFDTAGNLLSERYEGGPLAGLTVTNEYDHLLRRTNLAVLNAQSAVLSSTAYAYDDASRLSKVRVGTNTATYSYLANSPLVGQIFFTNDTAWRMTTTKTYDHLDRLLGISSVSSASSVVSFGYSYNAANQRTSRLEADNSRWQFGYDSLGQVVSGKRYWSDGVPTAGQQFEYAFDDIGNRTGTKAGGDENGANLRSAFNHANSLNQYTNREVPGAVDVMGVALATSSVTVNNLPVYRKGEYFRKELPEANASAPVWASADVAATGQTTVTRHDYVPQTPETFSYDVDGNLTQDGRWQYTWDAENRLIAMTNIPSVPDDAKMALTFAYDWQGRRIEKVVYNWNPSTTNYQLSTRTKFVYDGWNLIARLDGSGNLLQTYSWGLDLSGSLQGAGGVGGLLFVSEIANSRISNSYAPAYDGNGNVMALINCADGTTAARYEYGPFGEVLRATYANPLVRQSLGGGGFRFSTKYQDDETDLLYYGYRYYNLSAGRWSSRDPLEERGGPNVYGFASADPISAVDSDGRRVFRWPILFPPIEIPWPKPTNPWPSRPMPPGRPSTTSRGCGKCGGDVTSAVDSSLAEVDSTYAGWELPKKAVACAALQSPLSPGFIWEFEPFYTQGYPDSPAKCEQTFTYRGKCYWAGSFSYLLWGRMNALCNSSFPTGAFNSPAAIALVYKWVLGVIMGNPDGAVAQAVAMTQSGFDGRQPGSGVGCEPSTEKADVRPFWKWWPYKEY